MLTFGALRERVEDIPELVTHLLENFGYTRFPLSLKIVTLLQQYAFPGNVRELRNMLERAVLLSQGQPLTPAHFPVLEGDHAATGIFDDIENLHEVEKRHILQILKKYNGDKKLASDALGMSFSNLYRKLQQFRLSE